MVLLWGMRGMDTTIDSVLSARQRPSDLINWSTNTATVG